MRDEQIEAGATYRGKTGRLRAVVRKGQDRAGNRIVEWRYAEKPYTGSRDDTDSVHSMMAHSFARWATHRIVP